MELGGDKVSPKLKVTFHLDGLQQLDSYILGKHFVFGALEK